MKKLLLSFYFVVFANFLFAQNSNDANYTELHHIWTFTNPNGVMETLKVGNTRVYYFSTAYPKEVELKVKNTLNSQFVSFPNETKIYELGYVGMDILQCISPDGSKQIFQCQNETYQNLGTYKTTDKNGVAEFLDLRHKKEFEGFTASYWTSTNTKKIILIAKNIQVQAMCQGGHISCEVQFPSEKTVYKVEFKNEEIKPYAPFLLCTNTTTNATQKFEWIRK